MTSIFDIQSAATGIFSGLLASNQQEKLDSLANSALSNGITKYSNGDYNGAAKEFKRAFALSPNGDNAATSMEYLSKAYQQTGEYDKAVKAYETAISMNANDDDLRTSFGNLLYTLDRTEEAEAQYREAVRIDRSAENLFSLGQAQMTNGKYSDAKENFEDIIAMDKTASQGYYGLGQVLAKMKDYDGSVAALKQAVDIDGAFYDAWAELGYTYADMGETEKSEEVFNFLEDQGQDDLADTLSRYLYEKSAPKIAAVLSESTFAYALPAKTPVAALSSYLTSPGSSKTFTMQFMFDKEMDAASVQSIYNWKIQRSDSSAAGERYNNGMKISDTEVSLPSFPVSVYYDPETMTATVTFKVSQLATSINGTIDPSHIMFKFSGKDKFGNAMDVDGDQYAYATGIK